MLTVAKPKLKGKINPGEPSGQSCNYIIMFQYREDIATHYLLAYDCHNVIH